MHDVQAHLRLAVGGLPDGCSPQGLEGDGSGRMVGATFLCPADTALRIQRFDSAFDDRQLPASPTQMTAGRLEWRDQATGDVIRVAGDGLAADLLWPVAASIEVHD